MDSASTTLTRRLRVAIVSAVYLETRARALLDSLATRVDLTLVSPDSFPSPYGQLKASFDGKESYRVSTLPARHPVGLRTSTRWTLSGFHGFIASTQPDVIHIENEPHSFSTLQSVMAARRLRRPARIVVSSWGNLWPPGLKGLGIRRLTSLVAPHIDCLVSANTAGRHMFAEAGMRLDRIRVFPSTAVDTSYYQPLTRNQRIGGRRALGLPDEAFVVGFSGRFVEEKGLIDLVDAVSRTRSRCSLDVQLLCVGDGPLRTWLAAQPGVRVESPGADGRVLPFYQTMDILVLPSKTTPFWKEQFGRSLVEAMACGVPAVGSNSGAIPDVIGTTGLVFPEGDVSALQQAIEHLALAPARRASLAVDARQRAEVEFSVRAIAAKTLDAYSFAAGSQMERPDAD